MKQMIDKISQKQHSSQNAYNRNLNRKVKMAKDSNARMDDVARRAREVDQKRMEDKYSQFQKQVKKFHEKLVVRKEILEFQQWETKMANERRFNHHMETSKNIKQLDRDKLLQSISAKQEQAEERVARKERDMEEAWKIYNEEEANKRAEREKKIQRNIRKLELKKEKVIGKLLKHDAQVAERKAQQNQAIQLKRELNLRMIEERKQMQDAIKTIDKLESRGVDAALAKQGVDGGAASPLKKKGKKKDTMGLGELDLSDTYRPSGNHGW